MTAADPLQRISEAVASILDVDAAIATITGRADGNIVRFNPRTAVVAPGLAYIAGEAKRRNGIGLNYDVTLTLRAEADTPAVANALIQAAIDALTVDALLGAGADAVLDEWTPSNPEGPADGDAASSNPAIVLAVAELSFWLTM